jgi:hypothetical protein
VGRVIDGLQNAYVAAENMNGRMVECRTSISADAGVDPVSDITTLQVGSGSKWRHY